MRTESAVGERGIMPWRECSELVGVDEGGQKRGESEEKRKRKRQWQKKGRVKERERR